MRPDRRRNPDLAVPMLPRIEHHRNLAYPVPLTLGTQQDLNRRDKAIALRLHFFGCRPAVCAEYAGVGVQFQWTNQAVEGRTLPAKNQPPWFHSDNCALRMIGRSDRNIGMAALHHLD